MAKIVSKFGSAYEFMLNGTTGQLRLAWRNPANTALLRNSTVAVPAADGQRLQIRATLDVNNGAGGHTVTFYYRTDTTQALTNNTGWTQLGTPIVTTGTTSIRADATALTLGSRPGGTAHFWPGNLYQALILNGLNGTIAANPDFRTTTQLTSTQPNYTQWQDTAQNPWTINGTNATYNTG